jgi:hypothetical protein
MADCCVFTGAAVGLVAEGVVARQGNSMGTQVHQSRLGPKLLQNQPQVLDQHLQAQGVIPRGEERVGMRQWQAMGREGQDACHPMPLSTTLRRRQQQELREPLSCVHQRTPSSQQDSQQDLQVLLQCCIWCLLILVTAV